MPSITDHFDVKTLKGLTADSRKVEPGFLFAALPGARDDGRAYIGDALKRGASAVLAPVGTQMPGAGAVLIEDKNPRKRFSLMAAEFYGAQPDYVAAVTGTNGKTSTVHFLTQLWEALGLKGASMGTLTGALTTPGPAELHARLSEMAGQGVTHLAMEASSHGLDQYRLDGVKVRTAGFTNLSRDHMDYHGSEEKYLVAKMRLFSDVLQAGGTAVLNADVPQYQPLSEVLRRRGDCTELSYGAKGEAIRLLKTQAEAHGQHLSLRVMDKPYEVDLPLVGGFQAMNALCALGLAMAGDSGNHERNAKLVKALESLKGAPGRLQLVSGHSSGAGIYVDYAHTPDALANILQALRPHTAGRLICVFGCGGDRDKGKRPQMGKIATELADIVIVTDDNPRSEEPAQIRAEIMAEAPGALEIGDRGAAIQRGVDMLAAGDVLVVAGKGHEQGQIFKTHTEAFDDVRVVQAALDPNQKKANKNHES